MTNVKSYTDRQLLTRVQSMTNFTHIPKDLWILGIRSTEDTEDAFDDKFYIFYGQEFIMVAPGTTNPGKPSLRKLGRSAHSDGSFIMRSDMWHYDLWKNGKHKGRMDALVQNRPVIGFRDNNLDGKSQERGKMYSGFFGINFHASTYNYFDKIIKKIIGGWSYGCQVVNDRQKYNEIISMCKKQKTISYCLLKEF